MIHISVLVIDINVQKQKDDTDSVAFRKDVDSHGGITSFIFTLIISHVASSSYFLSDLVAGCRGSSAVIDKVVHSLVA